MGRTAAAGWKQMASLQLGLSVGCVPRAGPEEHLGKPEAADLWSISKCFNQHRGLCCWSSAAVGLGLQWQSVGQ